MNGKIEISNAATLAVESLEAAAGSVVSAVAGMRAEFGLPSAAPHRHEAPPAAGLPLTKMEWDSTLSLGVPELDLQHRDLMALANLLLHHSGSDIRTEVITGALSLLGRALAAHFDTEEALMHASPMPPEAVRAHVEDHNRILDHYVAINLAAAMGQNFTGGDLFRIVRSWLLEHLERHDWQIRQILVSD